MAKFEIISRHSVVGTEETREKWTGLPVWDLDLNPGPTEYDIALLPTRSRRLLGLLVTTHRVTEHLNTSGIWKDWGLKSRHELNLHLRVL
jgi:hypothetical protein